jgi:hypothetical protein
MSEITTYSFEDVACTIVHDSVGQKSMNGKGIGQLTIAYTNDLTGPDLGADGSVMITKVISRMGQITIEVQQTSSANAWLIEYANTVVEADSSEWAAGTITIEESFDGGVTTTATDCALLKRPDRSLKQQGDHVSWVFFSPHITQSAS